MVWTKIEKEFIEINYLRMSNKELAAALNKTADGIAGQLSRQVPSRIQIKARERDWDLPFGCQVTEYLSHIDELQFCEVDFQSKGIPYIICLSQDGFAIYRSITGNSDIDSEEPPRNLWVKCHNHPVYGRALP